MCVGFCLPPHLCGELRRDARSCAIAIASHCAWCVGVSGGERYIEKLLISWSAAMWASGPAAAARPVEAGLGPARDGWPPTSALALLVKMAAVAIAATKVQAYSAQAPVVFRLLSHFAHARAARPASLREGMSLPRFDPAAKSCSLEPRPTLPSRPQLLSSSQKTGASYAASLRMLPASLAVRCTTRMC